MLTNDVIYELHDYGELTSYLDDRPTTLQSDEILPHIYKKVDIIRPSDSDFRRSIICF